MADDVQRATDSRPATAGRPWSLFRKLIGRLQVAIVVVGFVSLVSAIFSVVGTISCCVLFGMMLGSLRVSKWNTVPISLLFPAVTIALLQFPAPAVPLPKAILMAGVSFATFWGVYLVTYLLMLAEKRGGSAPEHGSPSAEQPVPEPPLNAELAALQGRWINLPNEPDPPTEAIEFDREAFKVEPIDPHAGVPFSAGGRVHCESLGPFKIISIISPTGRPDAPRDGNETWIYAISSGRLIIASHFDGRSSDPPLVRQYRRVTPAA